MGQVQHARDGGGSEGDRLALSEFKMVRVLGEGTTASSSSCATGRPTGALR